MGVFSNDVEIYVDNPFINDKLEREKEIRNLTDLFKVVDNQMVLAINSPWGTGKTTFLKMWAQYLKNIGYKVVFFNAWENDFVQDPFIAIVNEIREAIHEEAKMKKLLEKAKRITPALIRQIPKVVATGIKNTTGFDAGQLVDIDEIEELIEDKITQYKNDKDSVDAFKKELSKVAGEEFEDNQKPIVIFIDELDRCRPSYAINVLERIKHLFNVQNIIFILGIDKESLSSSIKTVYGGEVNAERYLTRFIDMEYSIQYAKIEEYIDFLLEKYKFSNIFDDRASLIQGNTLEVDYGEFKKIIITTFVNFNIPLREIEKILLYIYIILKSNTDSYIYPYVVTVLCVLKKLDMRIYTKIKRETFSFDMLIEWSRGFCDLNSWFSSDENEAHIIKAILIWLFDDKLELRRLQEKIERADKEENIGYEKRILELVEYVNQHYGKEKTPKKNIILNKIYEKIELYSGLDKLN